MGHFDKDSREEASTAIDFGPTTIGDLLRDGKVKTDAPGSPRSPYLEGSDGAE